MKKCIGEIENDIALFYGKLSEYNVLNKTERPLKEFVKIYPDYKKNTNIVRMCFMAELTDNRVKIECERIFNDQFPEPVGNPVSFNYSCEDQKLT